MYRPIFGHSFAVLVAPIFLSVVAFNFLNKKKAGVSRNAEDAAGKSGSSTTPTETNFGISPSSTAPTEANNGPSGLSTTSTEANSAGSSLSTAMTETSNSSSNSSIGMTGTNSDACSSSIARTESNHGAPSLLTMPTGDRYDVFLSFRGPDTRDTFTSHLYNGLVIAGIRAFRDDNELRLGEQIGPDLLAAIENSKILIPIFSVNYGSSKWCLDELLHIMECKKNNRGHIVLPIFYKVEPAHMRHQIKSFEAAFQKHEMRFEPMILNNWKQALKEVSNLKGWEAKGDEGELVKLVVQKVLSELKKEFELTLPEFLVGIDGHVKKVMKYIDNNSSATLFVGIYGMGGIGKTTLAKTIYNKLSNKFEHRSYIADIRESCGRNGLVHLQNQLIFDILRQKNQVDNKDKGIELISSKCDGKKVLILLDDVNDDAQLTALVGSHNWFFSGSRILITTRNKSILEKARVDYMYEHQEMDENQSLILFSRHAFLRNFPPSEFENLSHDVVSTTGGLPLSLEVLGSFLYGKNPKQWEVTINRLRKIPHKKVLDKLMISYDALESRHKEMFLDIACFFAGTDGRMASSMWDTYGFSSEEGIEVLNKMSLIKVGDNHELKMHNQLRDLGREIVRMEDHFKPQCRSRLWDSSEILKVLKEDKGTNKIQAIYLSKHSSEGSSKATNRGGNIHSDNQFKSLTSLRLLHVSGALFRGDFRKSIEELRCLRWWNCPSTFEAKNFPVKELVGLDLSRSQISEKWQGWRSIMNAENLKFLDLTSCESLGSTVFLSAFKNLEILILRYCWRVEQIDFSIGDGKLKFLDLTGCQHLKGTLFRSVFKNLEVLILRDCEEVEKIDSWIGGMESLVCLDLTGCRRLKKLPIEVGKLKALKQLLLKDNENISEVPDSIENLQNLEILNISGTGIKELPSGIRRLRKLRDLNASWCKNLGGDMPESICNLSSLQHLDFDGCEFLKTLDVSRFTHLRTLSAKVCKNIVEVRGLENLKDLESLNITESTSIKRLDLPKSKGLKILVAKNCVNLEEIQGLDGLEYLEELYISRCASIERLDLPNSNGLNKLNVQYCNNLITIHGLDRLNFLESLFIFECASIETLNLPKSEDLKIFGIENCKNLVKIQGLDGLEFLDELYISGCTSIERLNLPKSKCLKILDIKNCEDLVEIQGLNRLEFLEKLYIHGCSSVERLDLSKSESLKILHVDNCKNLVEIQGLDRLELLQELKIPGCTSIEMLYLPKSKDMKILDAENCKNLVDIQGIDRLEFLEKLYISQCASIKRLNLTKSKGLNLLFAEYCENLVEIQGLDRLEFLEILNISRCTSFGRLPDLCCFDTLQKLAINGCNKLHDIQSLERFRSCKSLWIEDCKSLSKLPNLSNLDNLQNLFLSNCHELREIPGIEKSTSLECIAISGCPLIEILQDLSSCANLISLVVQNCKNLTELRGLEKLKQLEELDISGCESLKTIRKFSATQLYRNYEKNPFDSNRGTIEFWKTTGTSPNS